MAEQSTAPDLETDLVVRRRGRRPGEAPTLFLLHGLTDCADGWLGALDHWDDAYALVAVDQRGHGDSPRFTEDQLRAHPGEVMVDDAVHLLEQLPEPAVLVGHSLGGAVALTVAVRRPDLVRGVLAEDPAPLLPDEPQVDPDHGKRIQADLQDSLTADDEADLLDRRRAKHPGWRADELLVTGLAEQRMDLDYVRHGDFKPVTPWPELFEQIKVPTLVISGGDFSDICITEEIEDGIAEIDNPHVTLTRVAGAAHCVRRAQPETFYQLADDWLEQLAR